MEHFFNSLPATVSMSALAILLPAITLSLLVGFLFGRTGRRGMRQEVERLERKVERAERQSNEQSKRTIARMRRELDTVANLALALPRVVRDLNRDDIDPAEVPRLILRLADAVFDPRQVLLYGIRPDPAGGQERVLRLSAQRGLKEIPEALKTIRLKHGKIGWVVRHELDMLQDDWETLRRTEGVDVPDNHPTLKFDIIGPLVHHRKQRQHVLGVLCIGSPRIHPRDVKLMFQMVTNFGSLALVSTWNMNKLRTAAHHDGLTALLNKRCFLEDVGAKLLVKCEREARPISIFMFDIDHFKTFNDTNGHPAGDQLLRAMSGLIRRHLRRADVACRYGGEEFLVAMPDTDRQTAYHLADTLRRAVETEPFDNRETQPSGRISVSGGVAEFPKDGSSIGELIQHADEALYLAKKGGRNRVECYKSVDIGDPGDFPMVEDPGACGVDGKPLTP